MVDGAERFCAVASPVRRGDGALVDGGELFLDVASRGRSGDGVLRREDGADIFIAVASRGRSGDGVLLAVLEPLLLAAAFGFLRDCMGGRHTGPVGWFKTLVMALLETLCACPRFSPIIFLCSKTKSRRSCGFVGVVK
jgi:hypothetical protein